MSILRTAGMADVLDITPRHLENHYKGIPHIKIGRSVRFIESEVVNAFKVKPKRTPEQAARAMAFRGARRCRLMIAERGCV